ncbi:MBL fold metallo-hydrolase [uncultured Actinomyces sp.]|uniref:MBL fold metallo-hydrolase n=1 Tax=uncultured Actinomyces sp. TaxID=249061 RepID=UPI0028F1069B|nr:MBL fold metallo-hydrolase [uncultured Actinomyces sp.]
MTFSRTRLAAALTMTVAAATASSLALVGTARADDTQSGTQSGSSWVPGTTLALANSKSVEASSVSASTLTFAPGTSEQTKIFVLSSGSSDAILIQSGGWYGIIDGGEDSDLPDGSDPRYPVRSGTAAATNTSTEWLLKYLDDQGVNDTNVAFYLGTHAHSDHIANADDIIYKYRPKVILSPEYSDAWITDENGLWDNQYVYDQMVTAANWAVDSYGATFIQRTDGYNTHITLGDADLQIIPFDVDEYYKTQGTTDANLMGWGMKVTANGHSAFLAADLMSTESDWETPNGFEDRIAEEVGEVDMLKAGHHGVESSNSIPFMQKLHPGAIVQTGNVDDSPDRLSFLVIHGETKWFPMGDIWDSVEVPALICEFSDDGITYGGVENSEWGHEYETETPRAWWFKAGRPAATTGWWDGPSGNRYYFNNSASAVADQWLDIDGVSYHFDETGALIEQKDASGKVTAVSDASSTPSPTLWWAIGGGAVLVLLAGGVYFLRRRG